MLYDYNDIRSKIAEEPQWFDAYGVPRYCEPLPDEIPNIYAHRAAFYIVECQSCGEEFLVQAHSTKMHDALNESKGHSVFSEQTLHYGDPPPHKHDHYIKGKKEHCAGDTMSSIPRRIVSYWEKEMGDWTEREDLRDYDLTPDWAHDTEDDF